MSEVRHTVLQLLQKKKPISVHNIIKLFLSVGPEGNVQLTCDGPDCKNKECATLDEVLDFLSAFIQGKAGITVKGVVAQYKHEWKKNGLVHLRTARFCSCVS